MSPKLIYALIAILALIVMIARFRIHPFVALVAVSLALGTAAGMSPAGLVKAFQDGVGATLGSIAVVVGLGTMLGKMMAESGGASRIATTLIGWFGERRVHWALMAVAFIVGLPMFFQVGFVLLIPLVFTIARRTGTSLIKVGIPLVAGLHNPMAAQLEGSATAQGDTPLPGFGLSLFTILVPVLLMLGASAADVGLAPGNPWCPALDFLGNPIVALLLTLLFAFWALGIARGVTAARILAMANDCLAPTAAILLVIGAGGAGLRRLRAPGPSER